MGNMRRIFVLFVVSILTAISLYSQDAKCRETQYFCTGIASHGGKQLACKESVLLKDAENLNDSNYITIFGKPAASCNGNGELWINASFHPVSGEHVALMVSAFARVDGSSYLSIGEGQSQLVKFGHNMKVSALSQITDGRVLVSCVAQP